MNTRSLLAEFFGTMILVLGGAGTAVIAGADVGLLGVALAFGLSVMGGIYAFGPISGAHFNPAVSIGLAAAGKFSWANVPGYIIAQVLGGVVGAGALYLILSGNPAFDITASGLASNGYGLASPAGFSMMAGAIAEIVVTFIFVTVILSTTHKEFPSNMGGIVVGLTLAAMILVSGYVTNASLNPARSLATAVFEGGTVLTQVWFFWVTPIIGAVLAAAGHKLTHHGSTQ